MISEYLINEIMEFTKDQVKSAEAVINDKVEEVEILRKEIKGNVLKVFVNTAKGKGTITDIRLKDDKGNILLSKPFERVKTTGYAIVSSFYIRFIEKEVEDPINIFEMANDLEEGEENNG
ncbi:MAG: hypothetical protein SOU08_00100 [Anaerococcus sp.]|nr:hypothetical protein [Anaerococcus sp.]